MGWLTRSLTKDPRFITIVAACGTLPIIFFSLHAGAIADRVDKRRALINLNLIAAILAGLLGALVHLGLIQIWHVMAFALANGVIAAFDVPVRQSFNVEMVGREDLPSAIALNSTAFNTARVLGPAVGGFLIHQFSIAGCFFINSLSFGAIIAALAAMQLAVPTAVGSGLVKLKGAALWRGILFVRRHRTLRLVIFLVAIVSYFAMSFATLLPVFAKDVFQTDERGYSILLTCNGVGALLAASSLVVTGSMRHKGKRLLLGAFLFSLSTLSFALAPNLTVGCIALIASGYFLMVFLMTANTLVQTFSPDALRGRIFAFYSMSLIGSTPLGAIVLGLVAKAFGARTAVALGQSIAAAAVVVIFFKFRELWKEK